MTFEWKLEYSVYSVHAIYPMEHLAEEEYETICPLPWTPINEDPMCLSPDDTWYNREALGPLTDSEFEEFMPSSTYAFQSLSEPPEPIPTAVITRRRLASRSVRRLCRHPDCIRVDRGGGLCGAHGGGKLCSAESCEKASRKSGLCTFHYRATHKKPIVERKCRLKPCSEQLV